MKYALLFITFGFCIVSKLPAQEENTGETHEAKGRVAWFVYTDMPEGLENPVSIMTGKDIIEVTLSTRSPSKPIKIPADGILRIVRKIDPPKDPKKPEYLTLAQATVAEGINKALIILVPVAKNPSGTVFQTKVQDLAFFRGGNWLYLNLTSLRVGLELDKTKIELKPGDLKIYDPPVPTEPTNMPIRYSFYNPTEQEWKMLSSSTVVRQATRREICIFSWDPVYNRISHNGITFPVEE